MVAGDLNAHAALWDLEQPEDQLGERLSEWMADTGMLPLNDGAATRINPGTCGTSAPDLTIMHASWAARTVWSVDPEVGSDHSAVISALELEVDCLSEEDAQRTGWNWRKADWPGFISQTEMRLGQCSWDTGMSLDSWDRQFVAIVKEAALAHIGRVGTPKRSKPWMSADLREAIRERNRLRRDVSSHREQWIEACRRVQQMAEEEKQRRWREFVEELDCQAEPTKVWKVMNGLSGKTARSSRNEVLVHQGKTLLSNGAKAEAFMADYAAVGRYKLDAEDRPLRREVAQQLRGAYAECEEEQAFRREELEEALRGMKSKGAPGEDEVSPRLLQALGENGKGAMLRILNRSWTDGECPQSWRDAVIIPLLKSGKPPERTDSFRPVSLTSCVAKTLERMVAGRIHYLAEARNWWDSRQAGFRRLHSTEDQVLRLTQSISDGFQQKKPLRTVLALLDYTKAYDTVWRALLLRRMVEKGVPRRYILWVRGFLRNRRAKVKWFGQCGQWRCLKQGVPQGSVLAPLLFLFFIDGVMQGVPAHVEVSLYADDLAIWASHQDKSVAAIRVQAAVSAVAEWSSRCKLRLNAAKCEVSFFSTDPHEARHEPVVTLGERRLNFSPTPCFLGVTLDRTLAFRIHVKKVCGKVASACRLLGAVAARTWGCDRRTLRTLFSALVRGVLDYCGAAWQPWVAQSGIDELERAHSRAIRVVTGQLSTTPVEALRAELGVPRYQDVIEYLAGAAMEKALRLPVSHPRRIAADGAVQERTRRGSWRRLALKVRADSGLTGTTLRPLTWEMPPPWTSLEESRWSVQLVLDGETGKEEPVQRQLADAVATLSKDQWRWTVYTDGSALSGVSDGGSSAVITCGHPLDPQIVQVRRLRGAVRTCSFETEVAALHLALDWCVETAEADAVLICTDSQSALRALCGPASSDDQLVGELRWRLVARSAGRPPPTTSWWVSCGGVW
jgi:hypothetical protein